MGRPDAKKADAKKADAKKADDKKADDKTPTEPRVATLEEMANPDLRTRLGCEMESRIARLHAKGTDPIDPKNHPAVLMASGTVVDLIAPEPETILMRDIAWGLAGTNRFNGATRVPYSVAAHSVRVSRIINTMAVRGIIDDELDVNLGIDDPSLGGMPITHLRRAALMHDAHEVYIGDMTAPNKAAQRMIAARFGIGGVGFFALPPEAIIESGLRLAIDHKFELEISCTNRLVHVADVIALASERIALMPAHPVEWPVVERVMANPTYARIVRAEAAEIDRKSWRGEIHFDSAFNDFWEEAVGLGINTGVGCGMGWPGSAYEGRRGMGAEQGA